MKTKLLLAFFALSVISCSDDDSSWPSPPEKKLDQMVVKRYQNNGSIYKDVYDFDDDNKLTIINRYDSQDESFSKTTYEYNESGLLSVTKTYGFGMGDPSQPSSITSFSYDASSRITGIDDMDASGIEGTHTITSFVYNADNTISAVETVSGPPSEDVTTNYTFYINDYGHIEKKVDADNTIWTQAVYWSGNVESYTQLGASSMSFEFVENEFVKGSYVKINQNKFGGNFNNAILAGGFASVSNGVVKYVSQQTSTNASTSQVLTYNYEFDDDGYPVRVTLFVLGSSTPYEVREITYQE
ncbi:hypothetical protein [Flavobacterium sp. AG291]|uniref:hypothetical protein n=1 Tax=Flavobacterium sp. AG291 TaxID=2184000 RepID=UPI000E0A06F5|nr:hypothetical protein [Flavobacterium sp. AG291]RDI05635.1 hypothetical protein DEU42_11658 [Flavobacterium sp. AG291]